jgi:hypothetical protein
MQNQSFKNIYLILTSLCLNFQLTSSQKQWLTSLQEISDELSNYYKNRFADSAGNHDILHDE